MKIFAERLLDLRKERGISQKKLAVALGLSDAVICYWETDRSEPTAPNIVILSPCLFNLYAEYIMRNAGLEEAQAGIKIARRNINNLRYAELKYKKMVSAKKN